MNKLEELVQELRYDLDEVYYKHKGKEQKIDLLKDMIQEVKNLSVLLKEELKFIEEDCLSCSNSYSIAKEDIGSDFDKLYCNIKECIVCENNRCEKFN